MKTTKMFKLLSEELEKYGEILNGLFCYGTSQEFMGSFSEDLNELKNLHPDGYSYSNNFFTDENHKKTTLKLMEEGIVSSFKEIYTVSKLENCYWSYCSFRTYVNTYGERLETYLNLNDDDGKTEMDFVTEELRSISSQFKFDYIKVIDEECLKILKKESSKKLDFLNSKIGSSVCSSDSQFEIFTSKNAEKLFQRYFENYKSDEKRILSNVSFIYRVMLRDGYINEYVRPEMFKKEISKAPYNIFIEHSLKSFEIVNSVERRNLYTLLKQQIRGK